MSSSSGEPPLSSWDSAPVPWHGRDLADVGVMVDRGLISGAEVRAMFSRIEPELYRFPAVDPPSFRRAVDAIFPP
jgi:hypothetical protein